MQHLITALKVIAVAGISGFGVSMIHHNAVTPSGSFGIGVGVAVVVLAALLYQVWFWRKQP